jgi:hypothetical protein
MNTQTFLAGIAAMRHLKPEQRERLTLLAEHATPEELQRLYEDLGAQHATLAKVVDEQESLVRQANAEADSIEKDIKVALQEDRQSKEKAATQGDLDAAEQSLSNL